MPIFTVLQQRAILFPKKLSKNHEKQGSLGGFFCFFSISNNTLNDAYLIQQTAISLDFYPDVGEEKKLSILTGMYLYMWKRYENSFNQLVNKPFLNMLSNHLEIKSSSLIDEAIYRSSLDSLSSFCNWVYQNQQCSELKELYDSLPANMRAAIHLQKDEYIQTSDALSPAISRTK